MFLIMGLCFGISSFGLIIGAVWAYFSQQRKMEGRVAAIGTVVELTTQATARSSIMCPVVEFTTSSGTRSVRASRSATTLPTRKKRRSSRQ
jgi:hypothetical protein